MRMTGWTPADDLTDAILAAAQPRRFAGWSAPACAALLVLAAVGQLVLSIPQLSDSASLGTDMHGTHELGVFDLALAVAFVVGAVRPRLAAGLAWPCVVTARGWSSQRPSM